MSITALDLSNITYGRSVRTKSFLDEDPVQARGFEIGGFLAFSEREARKKNSQQALIQWIYGNVQREKRSPGIEL